MHRAVAVTKQFGARVHQIDPRSPITSTKNVGWLYADFYAGKRTIKTEEGRKSTRKQIASPNTRERPRQSSRQKIRMLLSWPIGCIFASVPSNQ
jgi:hypothetical protein